MSIFFILLCGGALHLVHELGWDIGTTPQNWPQIKRHVRTLGFYCLLLMFVAWRAFK